MREKTALIVAVFRSRKMATKTAINDTAVWIVSAFGNTKRSGFLLRIRSTLPDVARFQNWLPTMANR